MISRPKSLFFSCLKAKRSLKKSQRESSSTGILSYANRPLLKIFKSTKSIETSSRSQGAIVSPVPSNSTSPPSGTSTTKLAHPSNIAIKATCTWSPSCSQKITRSAPICGLTALCGQPNPSKPAISYTETTCTDSPNKDKDQHVWQSGTTSHRNSSSIATSNSKRNAEISREKPPTLSAISTKKTQNGNVNSSRRNRKATNYILKVSSWSQILT